jgi:hypothetical protein
MINLFNFLRRRYRFEIVEHDNVECLAKALRFIHKPEYVQYAEHHLKKGGMHARRVVIDADILAHCARNTPANCFEIGTHSGRSTTILAKNTKNRVWTPLPKPDGLVKGLQFFGVRPTPHTRTADTNRGGS